MSEHDNLQNAEGKNIEKMEEAIKQNANNTSKEEKIIDNPQEENQISTKTSSEEILPKKTELFINDTQQHVEDIEASNAEDAEDETNAERHEVEEKDYHAMSMDALVTELQHLIKNHKIQTISKQVNAIKTEFNAKFHTLLDEKKEEFITEGGNEIDFYYTNDTKKNFNELCKFYKTEIHNYYQQREQQLKQNLSKRLEIIEEIKNLLNVEEDINTTYKTFKALQEQWRNAGPIPRDRYNNAWNTYHHHVERFYDFLHLNNDLRDMDFKHNYEQKLKIIEQTEALAADDNINKAFRQLQVLHKLWKEELGPVAKEHRETIWERFSNATKIIHDKRQEYYKDLDKAYEKNLEKKEEIISNIQTIANDSNSSHSAWQKKIKQIETLREAFFNAGKVPLKSNEATWAKFKDSVRQFNRQKNAFYKSLKKDQFENLKKKRDLIKIAEDNKDSDDFDTITPLMKKIQTDWKKIGHVPRKDSDKVWHQFKDACNHYFNRLHDKKRAEDQPLYDAFDKKTALLKALKNLELSNDVKANVNTLKEKVSQWKSIGHVPQNKRYIDGKFFKAIDDAFSKLNIDKGKLDMIKFENKLETLADTQDTRMLDNEQNFIRKKISDIKAEINQLENNLLFFSNVKEDNPLVKDVHKNIANHKQELDTWKQKLVKIKGMYNS